MKKKGLQIILLVLITVMVSAPALVHADEPLAGEQPAVKATPVADEILAAAPPGVRGVPGGGESGGEGQPGKTVEGAPGAEESVSAEGPPEEAEVKPIPDPLEPLNRAFFVFNDKFYFWLLKPAANAYSFFVPEQGRVGVRNFFYNLAAPIRMVNSLLQLKMNDFERELGRFVLNSTVGLGGLIDVASRHPELASSNRDLGQTFGVYGVGTGFYIVIPVMGPSCLRDAVGKVGDSFLYPPDYIKDIKAVMGIRAFEEVNATSFRIGEYEDFKESAVDPYIALRDAYGQYRADKIKK